MRAVAAGAVAGLAALVVFLVLHALWILPIWAIAVPGVLLAALGGTAAGWAYDAHRERLPRARAARVGGVVAWSALVIAAAEPFALARGPVDTAVLAQLELQEIWPVLVGYFALATLVGAISGLLLTRTARAAGASALAALALAVGIGHNAPLIGYGWPALKMWSIMLAATATAAVTLVALGDGGRTVAPQGAA